MDASEETGGGGENSGIEGPGVSAPVLSGPQLHAYRSWKKNSRALYDVLVTQSIPWPSLTVQWFPDCETQATHTTERLLLGTQTNGQGIEQLRIVHFDRDSEIPDPQVQDYNAELAEIAAYRSTRTKLEIRQRIIHPGEVHKARHMPQNPDLLASLSSHGTVYVHDRTKHPLAPAFTASTAKPDMTLPHHTAEGFGLDWNQTVEGLLVSCAGDIAVWDVTQFQSSSQPLNPIAVVGGQSVYNDSSWQDQHVFGSAKQHQSAGILSLHDLRDPSATSLESAVCAESNTISFHPTNKHVLASGTDACVELWDARKLDAPTVLIPVDSAVTTLHWSPHHDSVLGAALGSTVVLYDVAKQEPTLFVHGGHTAEVNDFSFNPAEPWLVASAAADNLLHVWRVASALVC